MSNASTQSSTIEKLKSSELPSPMTMRDAVNKELTAKQRSSSNAMKSTCEQCNNTASWGTSIFCPKCGWYPKIGKFVPLDEHQSQPQSEEILSVWDAWKAVPLWAWPIIIGNFAIAIADISVAVVYAKSSIPSTVGFFQLTISALMLLPLHLFAYLKSLPDSDEIKPLDIFLKPRMVWKRTFLQLPKTSLQVWLASYSIGGLIFATLFLGGTNVNAILDMMAVEKKKDNFSVMGCVTNASEKQSEMSMEEALDEFTQKAAQANSTPLDDPKILPTKTASCCVIGFTLQDGESLGTLLLAEQQQGYWVYRGVVTCENISTSEQEKFKEAARVLIRRKPVVSAPGTAFWMVPYVMCDIEYTKRTPSGKLVDPVLKSILLK